MQRNTLFALVSIFVIGVIPLSKLEGQVQTPKEPISQQETLPSNGSALKSQISAEVRFVVAGIEHYREEIHFGQALVIRHEKFPKALLLLLKATHDAQPDETPDFSTDAKEQEKTQTAQWVYQQPKLSMLVKPFANNPQEFLQSEHLVTDGKQVKILEEYVDEVPGHKGQFKSRYVGTISHVETVLANNVWKSWNELDPRVLAYYHGDKPLDRLFLEVTPPPLYRGESSIAGSRCMSLELDRPKGYQLQFWIDVDHGFIIRRTELRQLQNNRPILLMESQVSQIIKSGDIWLPGLIESKSYIQLRVTEAGGKISSRTISIDRTITVSNFEVSGEMKPESFTLKWPRGTSVHDDINDKAYIVGSEAGTANSVPPAIPAATGQAVLGK